MTNCFDIKEQKKIVIKAILESNDYDFKELINDNEFDMVYRKLINNFKCSNSRLLEVSDFTKAFYAAIPELLSYMTFIPAQCFYKLDIVSINIPNTITFIDESAFANCRQLSRVILPNSVKRIADFAFSKCEKLRTVDFMGTIDEWFQVRLEDHWKDNTPLSVVKCLDGFVNV